MSASKELRVGIFVIASTTLIFGGVIALGSGSLFKDSEIVETSTTESVNGLQIGSPVKYRGVPIGEVTAISFADRWYPEDGGHGEYFDFASPVVIRMKVRLDVFGPDSTHLFGANVEEGVKQGLRARMTTAGLTGGLFVDLDLNDSHAFPATKPPYTPEYAYIPSAPSRFDQLVDRINTIANNLSQVDFSSLGSSLQQTVGNIDDVVKRRVDPMMVSAEKFIEELRTSNQRLQAILSDKAIEATMANVEKVTDELRIAFDGNGGGLKEALVEIPAMMKSAREAADRLDAMLASEKVQRILVNLDAATGTLAPTVEEYRGIGEQVSELLQSESYEISQLIEALRKTAENLEDLTARVKDDPAQVIFGKSPAPLPPGAPRPKSE
jgi:ABC-type transporter Mla subunit MlaD